MNKKNVKKVKKIFTRQMLTIDPLPALIHTYLSECCTFSHLLKDANAGRWAQLGKEVVMVEKRFGPFGACRLGHVMELSSVAPLVP